MPAKLTTEQLAPRRKGDLLRIPFTEFIKRARAAHGDRYEYIESSYIGIRDKVTIVCPVHGEFQQVARNHTARKQGCPPCRYAEGGKKQSLTIEQFLSKARAAHGDRYDYSKVEYVNAHTDITIVCREHGDFRQRPNNHIHGHNCPRCPERSPLRIPFELFVERARAVHGDKYEYIESSYKAYIHKVTIVCPIHGEFRQAAQNHVDLAHGCPPCNHAEAGRKRSISLAQFLKRAQQTHGDRYDYSRVQMDKGTDIVEIICREHGVFRQGAGQHIRQGSGCPICADVFHDTESYIAKATATHNGRYDYSETVYVSAKHKVKVICPDHGPFLAKAGRHVNGQICPECSKQSFRDKQSIGHEEFLRRAIAAHGDKYDYSLVKVGTTREKIPIVCPSHGIFRQRLDQHIDGRGCPACSESKGELAIAGILDDLRVHYTRERRFPGCRDKTTLPFDFYLPGHRILIEFDGIHHFEPIPYKGDKANAQKKFETTVAHDEIKNRWAQSHGYRLIRIPYTETDIRGLLCRELSKAGVAGAWQEAPVQLSLIA